MGKVIGGDAVGFQKHLIDVVLRNGQNSLDQIGIFEFVFDGAGGAETQHPGLAGRDCRLDVLNGTVAPDRVFAVIAEIHLSCFLLCAHFGQIFFGAEAGIGIALLHQLPGIDMVNIRALTLTVGAVAAVVAVDGGAFVKGDAVVLQGADEHLHRPRNLTLGVGILYAQKQNAAGLMSHALGHQALHQIAQMDKARGGGGHARNDRALRCIAGRKAFLQLVGSHRYVRKKQICKSGCIHKQLPRFSIFVLLYPTQRRKSIK